jgi:hypothetical protein
MGRDSFSSWSFPRRAYLPRRCSGLVGCVPDRNRRLIRELHSSALLRKRGSGSALTSLTPTRHCVRSFSMMLNRESVATIGKIDVHQSSNIHLWAPTLAEVHEKVGVPSPKRRSLLMKPEFCNICASRFILTAHTTKLRVRTLFASAYSAACNAPASV